MADLLGDRPDELVRALGDEALAAMDQARSPWPPGMLKIGCSTAYAALAER